MRTIKKIHKAEYRPIADLVTYSPLPTRSLQQIDPFIFLNHHGFQTYPAQNQGLPFGPHPHRGMETVTFILEGDIMHKDSSGHESIIGPGGVQYMTAGRGLIHAEVSSSEFKRKGGDLEILQLWLNLPASKKMIQPNYVGLQKEEIPAFDLDNGKIRVQQLFGAWNGVKGAFEETFPLTMSTIYLAKGGKFEKEIPAVENIFFYIVRGELNVNGEEIPWSPWYEEQCRRMNYDSVKIAQELDLSFEGSKYLVIEQQLIDKYEKMVRGQHPNFYIKYDFFLKGTPEAGN
jgi:redox-sensitive bicupin YhaK (pirin superfamily)